MRVWRTLASAALLMAVFTLPPSVGGLTTSTVAAQQPPGHEEFVPLSEIPPEEQIPAFTLVAAAYAAVWIILIGYVWSVSRRLQTVETELTALSRKRNAS
jgi:CcmD family protein